MINVVCLKFGTLYGPEYVNRLLASLKRFTTIPFKLHCFTDDIRGIHPDVHNHQLPHNLPGNGWWQKLYMFSKDMPITGRIFYIDLDTLITGNVDDIISHEGKFTVLHDFFMIRLPTRKDKWGTGAEAVGSGVLSWNAGEHTQIWETFIKDPKSAVASLSPHGDQKWIQIHQPDREYFQDLFPNQLVSFKVHCRNGLPKNARIVCYHGKPSIPESINTTTRVQGYTIPPTAWVKDYWKDSYEIDINTG